MKYQFGYLNDEFDERLEQLQLQYLDLYNKCMTDYTKKDWDRQIEYDKKSNELIKIILTERKIKEQQEFRLQKKNKK